MAKKKTNSKNKRFTMVFNVLLRSKALTLVEQKLFLCILSLKPAYPSYGYFQKKLGISSSQTISRGIKGLVEKKFVTYRKGNSFKKANEYTVIPKTRKDYTILVKELVNKMNQCENGCDTGLLSEDELHQNRKTKKTNPRKPNKKSEAPTISSSNEIPGKNKDKACKLLAYFQKKHKQATGREFTIGKQNEAISLIEQKLDKGFKYREIKTAFRNVFLHDRLKKKADFFWIFKDDIFNQLNDVNVMNEYLSYEDLCKMKREVIITDDEYAMPYIENKKYKDRVNWIKSGDASLEDLLYVAKINSSKGDYLDSFIIDALIKYKNKKLSWNKNKKWWKEFSKHMEN